MCSNDEPLFVELMVSDLSASLIKAEEKTDNEVESRSSTTRKRCTATPSKSSATEPSRKKQKGKNRSRPSLTTKGFKRHFANHDYYDYARVKPSQFELDSLKTSRGGVHNPFPVVLHNMMEEAAEKEFSGIVSWQTHGRAFLISDPKIFVAKVLPKYFKHTKLSSFQRQLSLYGFIRLTQGGTDRGAYYHDCFLRGRPFLCAKITRTRVKGTWVRTSSSPESEPNFRMMEPVVRLDEIDSQSTACSSQSVTSSSDSEKGSCSEENPAPSPVASQDKASKSSSREPVSFLDMLQLIDPADFKAIANEPPVDSGLQPPPAFPTHVVGPPKTTEALLKLSTPSLHAATPSKPYWAPRLPAFEIPSFTVLGAMSQKPPLVDQELAQFLTEVDLETDFDTEDVIQLDSI